MLKSKKQKTKLFQSRCDENLVNLARKKAKKESVKIKQIIEEALKMYVEGKL